MVATSSCPQLKSCTVRHLQFSWSLPWCMMRWECSPQHFRGQKVLSICLSMYIHVYLCISMYIYVYLCISMYIYVYLKNIEKMCFQKKYMAICQIHGVQERIFAATQVHWHDQGEMEVNKKDGNIKFTLTLILMMGIPKLVDHHQNAQNMALTEFPESWKMRMVDRNQGSPRFFGGIPPVPVLICEPSVFLKNW